MFSGRPGERITSLGALTAGVAAFDDAFIQELLNAVA
jgi:hypothetical protein